MRVLRLDPPLDRRLPSRSGSQAPLSPWAVTFESKCGDEEERAVLAWCPSERAARFEVTVQAELLMIAELSMRVIDGRMPIYLSDGEVHVWLGVTELRVV